MKNKYFCCWFSKNQKFLKILFNNLSQIIIVFQNPVFLLCLSRFRQFFKIKFFCLLYSIFLDFEKFFFIFFCPIYPNFEKSFFLASACQLSAILKNPLLLVWFSDKILFFKIAFFCLAIPIYLNFEKSKLFMNDSKKSAFWKILKQNKKSWFWKILVLFSYPKFRNFEK